MTGTDRISAKDDGAKIILGFDVALS